jgi:uncharacterized iron-regulated membrane protein
MKTGKLIRILHRWGSVITAIPVAVIIITGIILQLKKESDWIQPPMQEGTSQVLTLSFDRILDVVTTVPQAETRTWDDIDRLDVRPEKGMIKVRCRNRWEVQIDAETGDVLQVAYRRSDLIESIHDGSFLHPDMKLWIFLPAGLILFVTWATGTYLFIRPYVAKHKKRTAPHQAQAHPTDGGTC